MEQRDPKSIKGTRTYKVHFIPILRYNAKPWALTQRNKGKIQVMDIKFLRSTEGKESMDRTGAESFREVKNLLIESEEKQLQWIGHIKRVD
jgi:hypothetical protein